MELGTKEFNDSAMEMFGGKPKQQTAVEWLEDCLTEQHPNEPFVWNTRADLEALFKQAKEMEKEQQVYTEEEVLNIIDNFCETFKVDLILREDFNQWFEQFKSK